MRFSVVATGYDRRQVDSCLDELGIRLTRLAARAEGAAGAGREWDEVREEAAGLCGLFQRLDVGDGGDGAVTRWYAGPVEREAAELLARARLELDAAREEARQVREQAYAEAVQARREFEEALHARRRREARVDEILGGRPVEPVPADTPTAAAAAPVRDRAVGRTVG
ncbi:ATPase [Micromonospora sp. WMMA1363]|uniref:ATPase n=1 Tax=Micromonospora sp. WMMA1363 TaxID=3053985 RepID=UPI00259C7BF9|nr:ATPase [Micromonospora sp. WMMA1363]MDM4718838.1 ATPase [Micromonospora sp. WMMA1363]